MSVEAGLWHPIASSTDLPYRHTFHGCLDGQELAVWRADDDHVNVWENRCLHRGLRLSIGVNDGTELRCQYHGWRYANRTAGCTYIPAHPADAPARTICNRTYPAVERYGLVWTALEAVGEPPRVEALDHGDPLPLRGVEIWAPAEVVRARLTASPLEIDMAGAGAAAFFVQPVDAARCIVRGVLVRAPEPDHRIDVLRRCDVRLAGMRDGIEEDVDDRSRPAPVAVVEVRPKATPTRVGPQRTATLTVRVARKWIVADDVAGFELVGVDGQLPTLQPGAHIDVHLPNGLVRQYSPVNGPGELHSYTIGVKLEPESRGGSRCLHEVVGDGDELSISEPLCNFPLRRDSVRAVLVAGGIGVTPLLSMARTLTHGGLPCELHYFARSERHLAFGDVLARLGDSVTTHLGLTPDETAARLAAVVGPHTDASHLYVCGPGPMLDAARSIAAGAGWPDEAVHFEYFANPTSIDDSTAFEVELARSATTLRVLAGQTLLGVLREAGVDLPSSCEQGACGTCVVTVLGGEPDHQDVYLNDTERRRGDRMMACVSRARSGRLVLDV